MADFLSVLFDYWWLVAIIIGIYLFYIFFLKDRKNKDSYTFKEFKAQPLKKTLREELEKKVKIMGQKVKDGKLYIGFQKIAIIGKYITIEGKFDIVNWDQTKKQMIVSSDKKTSEKYSLLIIQALNNFFLLRWLGLGKYYFILKMKDENDNPILRIDYVNSSVLLNTGTDLTSYGNIWTNTEQGIEYLNDVSIKRMVEQTMMHLENTPDKVIHLEVEQAKKERNQRVEMETYKERYKDQESAGDTTII